MARFCILRIVAASRGCADGQRIGWKGESVPRLSYSGRTVDCEIAQTIFESWMARKFWFKTECRASPTYNQIESSVNLVSCETEL